METLAYKVQHPTTGEGGHITKPSKREGLSRLASPGAVNRAPYVYLAHRRAQGGPSLRQYRTRRDKPKQTGKGRKVQKIRNPNYIAKSDSVTENFFNNDPFAGSPTNTLLRLLLPLNAQV